MGYVTLYWAFIKIKLYGAAEYRGAFWMQFFSKASVWTADIVLIWILVDKFQTIAGWGPYEVMLLYAFNLASYSLAGIFLFHPCTKLPARIQSGEFDEILTRPMNPFLYLITRDFSTGYFSNLTVAGTVMAVCFIQLGIRFEPADVLFFTGVLLGGALIQGAAFLFASVPSFWMVQNNGLFQLVLFELKDFIRYPISAYHKLVQIVLTLLVPYAFINFYPVQYFLHKNDFLMFHPGFQYLTPVVGIVLFGLAYRFWCFGIRHYTSTGS